MSSIHTFDDQNVNYGQKEEIFLSYPGVHPMASWHSWAVVTTQAPSFRKKKFSVVCVNGLLGWRHNTHIIHSVESENVLISICDKYNLIFILRHCEKKFLVVCVNGLLGWRRNTHIIHSVESENFLISICDKYNLIFILRHCQY